MKSKTIIIVVFTFIIFFLIYWPTFRWLVSSWLSNDYYSHGFLVPVVSSFFVWTKRDYLQRREPSIIGIPLFLLGALFYALNIIWEIRVLGALSFLIVITALVFSIFGVRTARMMIFPLIFLLFMIPAPFVPDTAYRLQEVSVLSSSWLLDVFGLPVTSSGPEIYLKNATFTIGLPCSGINTLIALLALTAIYGYMLTGAVYKRVLLFILAFPIAIIANILRIATIIIVAYNFNIQTATGWYHNLSSPLFFILAFLALVLIGRIMRCRFNFQKVLRRQ